MAAPSQRSHRGDSRSGGSSGAALNVVGLKEFRRELKQLADAKTWNRELSRLQRDLAKQVAGWAQFEAAGMGGVQRHFSSAIKGRGGVTGARVQIADSTAHAAFWGAKKRTGWYAAGRYRGNPSQHPDWVGAGWDVGVSGQGPYAINEAIASNLDQILAEYEAGIDDITARAFPD